MDLNKLELLAPAGTIESFKAACQNGADAVYMGIEKFNARVMAENFNINDYIDCIEYAHMRNVKVYLTLNTLLYDDEINEALEIVLKLYSKGLDAVIVQDIGFAMLIHDLIPDLQLHASTQMSIYSLSQVKYLQRLGFTRVVLARELSVEEIKYICKNCDIEIEVFVHGALCVCFSGQCLLSSTIGNRSANRGSCAQPCRMKYSLYNSKNKEIVKESYLMSKKDILGLDYISNLASCGVTSLKLEGRNKSPNYVAGVTKIYRKYIDNLLHKNYDIKVEEKDKKELLQLFNRNGISEGYLKGVKYKNSITLKSPKNMGLYLGKVIDQKGVYIKVKLEENIDLHDGFEIYSDECIVSNIVTCIKNENGKIVNIESEAGKYVWLGDVNKKVKFGSPIYKTSNNSLNRKYAMTFQKGVQNRKNVVEIMIKIKKNEKIFASVKVRKNNDFIKLEIPFDYVPQLAKNKQLNVNVIIECFNKTKDTPFKFDILNIDMDSELFVPTSILNEFRRYVINHIEALYIKDINISEKINNIDKYIESWKEKNIKKINSNKEKLDSLNIKNSLFIYSYNKDKDYINIYEQKYKRKLDAIYIDIHDYIKNKDEIIKKYISKINVFISITNVVLKNSNKIILENLEKIIKDGVKGVLLGNLAYIEELNLLKKKYSFILIADYTLNTSNIFSALVYTSIGFDIITTAYEMELKNIKNILEYVNIQIVNDYITAITSRYCILGSFVANRKEEFPCSMPCINEKYYLKDNYGYKYHILCNNLDCTMKVIRSIKNLSLEENNNFKNLYSLRNVLID